MIKSVLQPHWVIWRVHKKRHVSHAILCISSSSSPCLTDLTVFFDPAAYSVPEGENEVLVLRTDNEFAVPFTIDVTLRDGTAVGKYICGIHFTLYSAHYNVAKTLLCSGQKVPT